MTSKIQPCLQVGDSNNYNKAPWNYFWERSTEKYFMGAKCWLTFISHHVHSSVQL